MNDDTPISRGFGSGRRAQTPKDRVPPGQYVTPDSPVLSAGPTPQIKFEDWTFALQRGGSLIGKWSWEEFEALPQTTIKTDIHCVTKWSKLDTVWRGVTFDDLLKAAGVGESLLRLTLWPIATAATQQMFQSLISSAARVWSRRDTM